MANNRQFEGVWIPKEIWLCKDLTLQEKVFFVEIRSLDSEKRGCFATNEYFSEFFGISKVRVSEVISSLVKKGYISNSIHHEEGRGNIRTLRTLLKISLIGAQRKVEEGHKGKLKRGIKESLTADIGINSTINNTVNKVDVPAALQTHAFLAQWEILTSMPKWKKKNSAAVAAALRQLERFDPEFATNQVECAIAGNWQGVVFPDTAAKYEDWKRKNQQPKAATPAPGKSSLPNNLPVFG